MTLISQLMFLDGKKEQIEAVNLELVSMKPYTGNNLQTKGQEACELPSDPYEEYFVPVNEHRKYIRYWRFIISLQYFHLKLILFLLLPRPLSHSSRS